MLTLAGAIATWMESGGGDVESFTELGHHLIPVQITGAASAT